MPRWNEWFAASGRFDLRVGRRRTSGLDLLNHRPERMTRLPPDGDYTLPWPVVQQLTRRASPSWGASADSVTGRA